VKTASSKTCGGLLRNWTGEATGLPNLPQGWGRYYQRMGTGTGGLPSSHIGQYVEKGDSGSSHGVPNNIDSKMIVHT